MAGGGTETPEDVWSSGPTIEAKAVGRGGGGGVGESRGRKAGDSHIAVRKRFVTVTVFRRGLSGDGKERGNGGGAR